MKLWTAIDFLADTEEKRHRLCGIFAGLVLLWVFVQILSLMIRMLGITDADSLFAFYASLQGMEDIPLVKLIMDFISAASGSQAVWLRLFQDIPFLWWAGGISAILFICGEHNRKRAFCFAEAVLIWACLLVFSLCKGLSASSLLEAASVLRGLAWCSLGIIGTLSGILLVWIGFSVLKNLENV